MKNQYICAFLLAAAAITGVTTTPAYAQISAGRDDCRAVCSGYTVSNPTRYNYRLETYTGNGTPITLETGLLSNTPYTPIQLQKKCNTRQPVYSCATLNGGSHRCDAVIHTTIGGTQPSYTEFCD